MESAAWATARRLESERLILEPLRREHADELAPVLGDLHLHRFVGGRPDSPAQLRARVERQIGGHSPDGRERWLNWTVRERATGQAVGTMQATVRGGEREPVAEVAWVIGAGHQRRGLATEGAGLMVSWLSAHGVARLRAHIHPGHDASMGVARAVGLQPTDVMEGGEVRWESAAGPGRPS